MCEDTPKKGRVSITKVDKNSGEHCGAGFVFQVIVKEDILDDSGKVRTETLDGEERELIAGTVVDTIVTDEKGMAVSRELYLGTYLIQEIQPGEYYANNAGQYEVVLKDMADDHPQDPIIVNLAIENEKTLLAIIKQDSLKNTPIAGVKFKLIEKSREVEMGKEENQREKEAEGITDQDGKLQFENLKHNTVYCLQEEETQPGYVLDNTIYEFTVDENGYIDGQSVYEMKLTNTANVVDISKQDITAGEELPGAELTITDQKGDVVEQWISGSESHRITGLPAGRYTLTEVTAPSGYDVAESISFELSDSLEVQKVILYDRPLETEKETEAEILTAYEPEETEMETSRETERKTSKETDAGNDKTVPRTGDSIPLTKWIILTIGSLIMCFAVILWWGKDRT